MFQKRINDCDAVKMKKYAAFILITLLVISLSSGAENASEQESSGIISSLPDIQIDSVENYNNSTGEATNSQSMLSWIIVLLLVFLGVILYSFDIDPKWVVLLIGILALLFFLTRFDLIPI